MRSRARPRHHPRSRRRRRCAVPDRVVARLGGAADRDPGRTPLAFEEELPAGVALRFWPTHHLVKCAIPSAGGIERAIQDERLREQYLACQHYGHELVFEFAEDNEEAGEAMKAIGALHANGILPDWWHLPASLLTASGNDVTERIAAENPQCRGIVASINAVDMESVTGAIRRLPSSLLINGISAGRALLGESARAWLAGAATDAETIDALRTRITQFAAMGER
jgi:5-dehydro-2-deoxygluconokinase